MHRIQGALERARRGGSFGTSWLSTQESLEIDGEWRREPTLTEPTVAPPLPRPPSAAGLDDRLITASQETNVVDAYRILRTQVLTRMREGGWTTLAITSPGLGEGKSLTAANLALSIAMEPNQSVLLVDCDLRNPSLHGVFGLAPGPGLSEFLTNDISLGRLVCNPLRNNLKLLPGGGRIANSSEMLASTKMRKLMRVLKSRELANYVILDLPAVIPFADMLAVAPAVDAVLLVVENGKTRQDALVRASEYLAGANIIGTVLNATEEAFAEAKNGKPDDSWIGRMVGGKK